MKCPACKEVLAAVELDGIEVDLCDACKGVWLDRGELELLHSGDLTETDFETSLTPKRKTEEKSRRCPICTIGMTKVDSAWDPAITLDRCPRKDGIWFDRGELNKVLAVRGKSDRVQNLLAGIFNTK